MNTKTTFSALLCAAAIIFVVVSAPAAPRTIHTKAKASARFEKLKTLVGDWYQTDGKTKAETLALRFRLTAGGTVLEETEFPGGHDEMMTMYHMDGSSLVMTHYCHIGNEPHMKAAESSVPSKIKFVCTGGGNMKSENDTHMHALQITTLDKNHLKAEWTLSQNGKPGFVAKLDVHRKIVEVK